MALTVTNLTKNSLAVTNVARSSDNLTWDDATWTWNDAKGTWESPRLVLSQNSKNSLSVTNITKN